MKKQKGKKKIAAKARKERLVQFRVTDAEYNELMEIAIATSMNYVSAVARVAVKNFILQHRS